jgi:hypothetical protein
VFAYKTIIAVRIVEKELFANVQIYSLQPTADTANTSSGSRLSSLIKKIV